MEAATLRHDNLSRRLLTRTIKPMWLWLLVAAVVPGCATSVAATQQEPAEGRSISFLSIVQDDDAAAADMRLKRFLELAVANDRPPSPSS